MSYRHLTYEDRRIIHRLRQQSMSLRGIAEIVGFSHSTVSRELRRLVPGRDYCAAGADGHARALRERANSARRKIKPGHAEFISRQLELTLSPEQLSSLFPARFGFPISTKTIYAHIYRTDRDSPDSPPLRSHLRLRGRVGRKKWRLYHGPIHVRTPVSERPQPANERAEFGHWEMDSFEGTRSNKAAALVLVERKSRFTLVRRLADLRQRTVRTALAEMTRGYLVRSVTTDNGTEFLDEEALCEVLNAPVYYCKPYHAWEKGSVENTIGLYRQFFRKGAALPTEPGAFTAAQELINSRPRKILGFKTASSMLPKLIS